MPPFPPSISKEAGRRFLTDRIRQEVDWAATAQARGEAAAGKV